MPNDVTYASPAASISGLQSSRHDQIVQPAWSPYLSESAHVFSLQNPTVSVSTTAAVFASPRSQQSSESVVISPSSKTYRLDDVPEGDSPDSIGRVSTKTISPGTPILSPRALYMKAKKEIEFKLKQKADGESLASPDRTSRAEYQKLKHCCNTTSPNDDCRAQATVDGTRSFLSAQNISKGTWFKDESHTSKISRKLFGKAPWHRKESGDSFISVSSSVRAVLKGKTPPAIPLSNGFSYTNSFNLVNNPFPGGEAVRVSTPPLDEDTADGKPRGFFTSMTPPISDGGETGARTPAASSCSRYSIHGNNMVSQPREWWEQMPQRASRRDILGDSIGQFEFDIPEHLPSSPMCPANIRHKSGGTGLCVYHGRRRTKSMLRDGPSR